MQIELLKFLLDATVHLYLLQRDESPGEDALLPDLQAVDRTLPDCDWFETLDDAPAGPGSAAQLWPARDFAFDD